MFKFISLLFLNMKKRLPRDSLLKVPYRNFKFKTNARISHRIAAYLVSFSSFPSIERLLFLPQ